MPKNMEDCQQTITKGVISNTSQVKSFDRLAHEGADLTTATSEFGKHYGDQRLLGLHEASDCTDLLINGTLRRSPGFSRLIFTLRNCNLRFLTIFYGPLYPVYVLRSLSLFLSIWPIQNKKENKKDETRWSAESEIQSTKEGISFDTCWSASSFSSPCIHLV